MGVPICPKCSSNFHRGAEDQCPRCGFSLKQAEHIFGIHDTPFQRVTDEAGALTHKERSAVGQILEKIERRISPVALSVYFTDHGQQEHFRSHALWIINHLRLHHASFGKREQARALDDAPILVREQADQPHGAPSSAGLVGRTKDAFDEWRERWHDLLHPLPPPVRREWMLILVFDVQLETACFVWGYMLDPYIDPDRINSSILKARIPIRERDVVQAIKIMMTEAAREIAASGHIAVRHTGKHGLLPRGQRATLSALTAAAFLAPCLFPPQAWAAPTGTQPAPIAEEVEEQPAAMDDTAPEWLPSDSQLLMQGKWWSSYPPLLFEPEPGAPRARQATLPQNSLLPDPALLPENDKIVPTAYLSLYAQNDPSKRSNLIDPQMLLAEVEKNDLETLLNAIPKKCNFRIYVSLFVRGQKYDPRIDAQRLIAQVCHPHERSVLIQYHLGDSESVQIAYDPNFHDELEEGNRNRILQEVKEEASRYSHGPDALYAGITSLAARLQPEVAQLQKFERMRHKEAQASTDIEVPAVDIRIAKEQTEKKESWKTKLAEIAQNPAMLAMLYTGLGILAMLGALILLWRRWKRHIRLLDSHPDIRLGAPYGAGVSRTVRYMDGKEPATDIRDVV